MSKRIAAFLLSTLSFPAVASDGVLEINQACATGPGCFAGVGSIVSRNIVNNADEEGISVGENALVRENTSSGNGGAAIRANGESQVISNVVDSSQFGLSLSGVSLGGGLARDNTVIGNSSFGITMSSDWVFIFNVVQGNNGGNANPQTNGGISGAGNYCGTTLGCP